MGRRSRLANNDDALVRTYEHKGRNVNIQVSKQGVFYADLLNTRIEASSLQTLIDRIKKAISTLGKIAIPVTDYNQSYDDPPEFTDLTLTAIARGGRSVCVDEDGDEHHVYGSLFRRLTQAEKDQLIAAYEAKNAAEKHLEKLIESFQIIPGDEIEKAAAALDAAAKKGAANAV